jgi:DNA-binding transcriptional MerR regulator
MRIGQLAKDAGVSVQAVRFYERRRLMRIPPRSAGGYRQYTESDLEIVRTIKLLQHFGFTLSEVRRVLQLWAIPGASGQDSPYPHGSHECLREVIGLGEQKLHALDAQIRALNELRDELVGALRELQTTLAPVWSAADAPGSKATPEAQPGG